jgi:hypothetical protein
VSLVRNCLHKVEASSPPVARPHLYAAPHILCLQPRRREVTAHAGGLGGGRVALCDGHNDGAAGSAGMADCLPRLQWGCRKDSKHMIVSPVTALQGLQLHH